MHSSIILKKIYVGLYMVFSLGIDERGLDGV